MGRKSTKKAKFDAAFEKAQSAARAKAAAKNAKEVRVIKATSEGATPPSNPTDAPKPAKVGKKAAVEPEKLPSPARRSRSRPAPSAALVAIMEASARVVEPLPPRQPLEKDGLLREVRAMRLHILSLRRRLGPATPLGPAWVRHGSVCLDNALEFLKLVPGLTPYAGSLAAAERCTEQKGFATQFAESLGEDAADMIERCSWAKDRESWEPFYADTESALDNVRIDLGRFGAEPTPEPEVVTGNVLVIEPKATLAEPVESADVATAPVQTVELKTVEPAAAPAESAKAE